MPRIEIDTDLRGSTDPIHGPLQLSIYGAPDYRKLYDVAGVLDGGVLSGHSPEAEVFMSYIGGKGRPEASRLTRPSKLDSFVNQGCKLLCSTRSDCPGDGDYLCVANSHNPEDSQLLNTCCRSSGSQLLQNSSSLSNNILVRPGNTPPAPLSISKFGCACNCTYVSQTCCGVESGSVSESTSLRLGVVQLPNSTTCCDAGTGKFSKRPPRKNDTYC